MFIHVATVHMMGLLITLVCGLIMSITWLQDWTNRPLAWWASASWTALVAMLLIPMGLAPGKEAWLYTAYALLGLTSAIGYMGGRAFVGLPVKMRSLAIAPATILALCLVVPDKTILSTVHTWQLVYYNVAFAYLLWTNRHERLASRHATIVVLATHAGVFAIRSVAGTLAVVLGPSWSLDTGPDSIVGAISAVEAVGFIVAKNMLLLAMIRERAEACYRCAATTDDLSGLANRRAFTERTNRSIARLVRDDGRLAVLLFDLDHFKSINDRFGHSVGDAAIRRFAETLSGLVRPTDVIGRIGGEEFAAFLPGADAKTAEKCAERIREAFARTGRTIDRLDVGATVSIGVTAARARGTSLDQLLADADRALYAAKAAGRDRVVVAATNEPSESKVVPLPRRIQIPNGASPALG